MKIITTGTTRWVFNDSYELITKGEVSSDGTIIEEREDCWILWYTTRAIAEKVYRSCKLVSADYVDPRGVYADISLIAMAKTMYGFMIRKNKEQN